MSAPETDPPISDSAASRLLRLVEETTIGSCRGPFDSSTALGGGGFGQVHRAHHLDLDIPVAVKLILTEDVPADELLYEARTVASLGDHPHILSVYATGVHECEVVFLVMPLAAGSLDDLIDSEGPRFAPARALEIARQATEGLVIAHARGVGHFDVKPGNLLFLEDEPGRQRFMLSDFGLAKRLDPESQGHVQGTPPYMSPEAWSGAADPQADLWAVGVLLFELLTGELPFQAPSRSELRLKIRHGDRAALKDLRPDLPRSVHRLVERALEPNKADRFPSARSLRDALNQAVEQIDDTVSLVLSSSALGPAIAEATNPSAPWRVRVWVDDARQVRTRDIEVVAHRERDERRLGDELRIGVVAERDCHLTVLNLGTSGKVTVLYPNPFSHDKRLRAGETLFLPERQDGFRYRLGPPAGRETIKVIASERALDLGALTQVGEAFRVVEAGVRTRDIEVLEARARLEELPPESWSEASIQLEVSA